MGVSQTLLSFFVVERLCLASEVTETVHVLRDGLFLVWGSFCSAEIFILKVLMIMFCES